MVMPIPPALVMKEWIAWRAYHRHKQSSFSHSQMGKPSSKEKERNYTKPYLWKTGVQYYYQSGESEVRFHL